MESKRSDNRRRRVLYDEAVQQVSVTTDPLAGASGLKKRRPNNYGSRGSHGLKTSDLIPTRWLTMGMVAAGSLFAIGIANLLDWSASAPIGGLDDAALQSLRLASNSGLARWMATVVFILAGLVSLQNFAMRRHRRDDYSGKYRVWLALAIFFVVASIQVVVPVDRIVCLLLSNAIQFPAFLRSDVGVASLRISALLAVFIRMFVEVRNCRSAATLLVLSLGIFLSAVLVQTSVVTEGIRLESQRWIENLPLLGSLMVLHCVIAFARYVSLDVQGVLHHRRRRTRKRKSRSSQKRLTRSRSSSALPSHSQPTSTTTVPAKPAKSPTEKIAPAATSLPSTHSRSPIPSSPLKSKIDALRANDADSTDDDSWDDEDQPSDGHARLSKAERRRLKKLHRQTRNAA